MYYLQHEQECFIGKKTQGTVERFISHKIRTIHVLNDFKDKPFYTHLMNLLTI